jgi:two-component system, OmpR family, sensor histidine kinase VicK
MDYFMYQVNKRWYRLYWAIMLSFNVALALIYVLSELVPSMASLATTFGLDSSILVITAINLLFLTTAYWLLAKRSLPFATLLVSMLFSIELLNGLSQTDPGVGAYLYVGVWLITAFFSGIYGLPILLGSVFITYVYISLQSSFEVMELSQASMTLIAGEVLVALASYFFWRSRFESLETQKVNQLSGMLRSNQQQSEILIQSISDGIIVTNTDGKISLMNLAAGLLTGWSITDAMNVDVQLVAKLSREDGSEISETEDPFLQVLGEKKHLSQIVQITGKDDTKHVVSLVISPIVLPDSTIAGSVAVMRDVSEQRAAEKQRAEFISTASHEMRTPVAAIEGYLALALNEKVSTVDSRARSYLDKAHSSTQHLGKLFQDLLTSSKAEDGRLSNHPTVVEMGAFMQQLTDDLKFAAEKKGLLAEFVIGGADDTIDATTKDASVQHLVKPLYYVQVDPDRMREVITNLFDNACKYTDSGKISIGLTGNTDVVQIYVRDTGAGIPPDDVPHLFQKFYRVDNSATRTIGGTGLGLFICRKIVELYHGRIWVESEVGKGSTFFINLPRLSTQKATELQESEKTKQESPANPTTPAKS